jgi:small subunit ribosomal protein S4
MAKRTGAVCRLCRREGVKLFLKGNRCVSIKCSFDKRSYSPGQHGKGRVKVSDYGLQMREKQKVKRLYGIMERQFRNYFRKAEKQKGITGEVLLQFLERRLDNVVYRARFASSRAQGRQMVKHGLFTVNGETIDIPSYLVKKGDLIHINTKEENIKKIKEFMKTSQDSGMPEWLKLDEAQLEASVLRLPERKDVGFPVQEQLIVELYSK